MKRLTKPFSLAAAALAAVLLAACGGGDGGELILGGTLGGLTKDGLEVINVNNGQTKKLPPTGNRRVNWAFDQLVGRDENFHVKVNTQPAGVECVVENGLGRTGAYNVLTIHITCTTESRTLGGSVSGLTGSGLVLINGTDQLPVSADGPFTMPRPVADGSPYGIVVLTQPAGQTCNVLNGTGTMGATPVNNVQVTCS